MYSLIDSYLDPHNAFVTDAVIFCENNFFVEFSVYVALACILGKFGEMYTYLVHCNCICQAMYGLKLKGVNACISLNLQTVQGFQQ